ncbi:MAG: translocation/assembly module TamB domain-containing protein [Polyangiaceae bacterium]
MSQHLEHGQLAARGLPEELDPNGNVKGELKVTPKADLDANLHFDGRVMQSPLSLEAAYAPSGVRFRLKSDRVAHETLARYGLKLAPGTRAKLEFSGEGPLGDIQFRGETRIGESALILTGKASALAPSVDVQGRLEELNLASLGDGLPKTSIEGRLSVEFDVRNDQPYVTGRVALTPSRVEEWQVPALNGEAHLEGSRAWAFIRTAPGEVTLRANAQLDLAKLERGIAFDAVASVPRLGSLQRYAKLPDIDGDVHASACGSYYPRSQRLDAGAAVDSVGLGAAGFELRQAHVSAEVAGAVADPSVDAQFRAASFKSHDRKLSRLVDFARLNVSVRGDPGRLRVHGRLPARPGSRAPSLALAASITPADQRMGDVRASIERGRRRVELRADRVALKHGLDIRGVRLSGAGSLTGSLSWRGTELETTLGVDRLDLSALSELLQGLPVADPPVSGTLSGEVELAGSLASPRGSIDISVEQFRRASDGFSGEAHLVASEGSLSGRVRLDAARIGSIAVTPTALKPNGAWTNPRAWMASSGSLRSEFALDSAALLERLHQEGIGVSGLVRGNIDIERALQAPAGSPLSQLPDVKARWSSVGLQLASTAGHKPKPFLRGIDIRGELAMEGFSGDSELNLEAVRGHTGLVSLKLESRVPYRRWFERGTPSRDTLLHHPLSATLVSDGLELSKLPEFARVPGLDGRLDLDAKLTGSVLQPNLRVDVRGKKLNIDELSRRQGLSGVGHIAYDGSQAELRFGLSSRFRSLVRARADLNLGMADALRGDMSRARANAKLVLDDFALAALPMLRAREVRGRASGELELTDLGGPNPQGSLKLEVPKGRIGDAKFSGVTARADLNRERARASLLMDQDDGFGQVVASAGVRWNGLLPTLDRARKAHVRLLANGWRLQALEPFVRGQVDQLDGRVDANATMDLIPGATKLDGFVRVSEGVLQVPALGQQLKNLEAQVDLTPNGDVRLTGGSVEGLSGRAYFDAAAKLDGLSLVAANAKLRIPEKEAMPFTYQGVPLGDGSGDIDLKARLTPKENRIEVDVDHFAFTLPRSPQTGVQSLEDDPHIRIGAHGPGGFVPIIGPGADEEETTKAAGVPTVIAVDLGSDFRVTQGTDLKVKLTGKLLIDSAQKHPVDGQIRLSDGRIDISGKIFQIEQGVISFQEDPSNPIVVAQAAWDSPSGYKVVAEYTGPLKNGKFKLRAEPALSQNEIVSLILFGTPDGSVGSSGGSGGPGAADAAGVGAGVATAPLNRAISDVTSLDIATRVDTSNAQSPRPELVVQVSPRVSAQVGYNLEEPKPGKAPDRTLFTLEFRIASRWSLATTFGDGGSSLVDLVWRYRY